MMKKILFSAAALVGALVSNAAAPALAEPDPTPPPYCAGNDPGDLLNGVTCEEEIAAPSDTPVSTRPSDPPPGGNLPGGGPGPGGGGGQGGGPGPG